MTDVMHVTDGAQLLAQLLVMPALEVVPVPAPATVIPQQTGYPAYAEESHSDTGWPVAS